MGEFEHTHHRPSGLDLTHEHDRGHDGHDHDEEIELVIARMLHKKAYTGLSTRSQRVVAIGIAAMRQALADRHLDDPRVPIPTTWQLRAPLVSRRKGDQQKGATS